MRLKGKLGSVLAAGSAAAVVGIAVAATHGANASSFAKEGVPGAAAGSAAPVVVELFTSEGCSSCPPADDLLRRIANGISIDGQPIIALSEHVTYWNNLGWADPFSQDAFSSRQDRYGARLGSEVYTPQAVVNGNAQFVGSDGAALSRALHAQLGKPGVALSITQVRRSGENAVLQVRSGPPLPGKPVELWAAVTDDSDQSNVLRGENGGRTLRHAAVVRLLLRVGTVESTGEQTVTVPLPPAVLRDTGAGHHLALIAQLPGQGTILGAAMAPL